MQSRNYARFFKQNITYDYDFFFQIWTMCLHWIHLASKIFRKKNDRRCPRHRCFGYLKHMQIELAAKLCGEDGRCQIMRERWLASAPSKNRWPGREGTTFKVVRTSLFVSWSSFLLAFLPAEYKLGFLKMEFWGHLWRKAMHWSMMYWSTVYWREHHYVIIVKNLEESWCFYHLQQLCHQYRNSPGSLSEHASMLGPGGLLTVFTGIWYNSREKIYKRNNFGRSNSIILL